MPTQDVNLREYPVYAICKDDLLEEAARVEASDYVVNLIQAATPAQMEAVARQILELMEDMGELIEKDVENVFDLDSWIDEEPDEEVEPDLDHGFRLDDLFDDGDEQLPGHDAPICPLCGSYGGQRGAVHASGPVWLCTNCGFGFDIRLHPAR